MDNYLLDTNILIRHLLNDHPTHSPIVNKIFESIAQGLINAHITTLVLHETVYVLENVYKNKREDIAQKLSKLISLNNLSIIDLDKKRFNLALKDYSKTKVDFPDCVYKQLCLENYLKLLSFDHHFSQINFPPTNLP